MKSTALAAAALVSLAAITGASADSPDLGKAAPSAQAPAPRAAEGQRFREHEGHSERRDRRHRHWRDDDDDDDGGRDRNARGDVNRPADPNAANAPVPDNGVFTGKARPKVEVQ